MPLWAKWAEAPCLDSMRVKRRVEMNQRIKYDELPTGAEMTDKFGRSRKGEQLIFYICRKVNEQGDLEGIGTGFYIANDGVFLSARHVFYNEDNRKYKYFSDYGDNSDIWGIVYVPNNRTYMKIPVAYIVEHETADIVAGKLMGVNHKSTGRKIPNIRIASTTTDEIYPPGRLVSTFFFPKGIRLSIEEGEIEGVQGVWKHGYILNHYSDGFLQLKDACYETSLSVPGGASGGPVVVRIGGNGYAFAVNSLGGEGILLDRAYVTPLYKALDLRITSEKRGGYVGSLSLREILKEVGTRQTKVALERKRLREADRMKKNKRKAAKKMKKG